MNAQLRNVLLGAVSLMLASASGWAVTTTIQAQNRLAVLESQRDDLKESLREVKEALIRIEDKLDKQLVRR